MCVMSMVMDHYSDKWQRVTLPLTPVPSPLVIPASPITPQEVDEFRQLLERAREYDRKHGEPECELQEKRDRIKKLADELGVDVSFVDVSAAK